LGGSPLLERCSIPEPGRILPTPSGRQKKKGKSEKAKGKRERQPQRVHHWVCDLFAAQQVAPEQPEGPGR
jgi:hypothetical protein